MIPLIKKAEEISYRKKKYFTLFFFLNFLTLRWRVNLCMFSTNVVFPYTCINVIQIGSDIILKKITRLNKELWIFKKGTQRVLSAQFQIIFNKSRTKRCLKTPDRNAVCVYVNSALNHHVFFFPPQWTATRHRKRPRGSLCSLFVLYSTRLNFLFTTAEESNFLSSQFWG